MTPLEGMLYYILLWLICSKFTSISVELELELSLAIVYKSADAFIFNQHFYYSIIAIYSLDCLNFPLL